MTSISVFERIAPIVLRERPFSKLIAPYHVLLEERLSLILAQLVVLPTILLSRALERKKNDKENSLKSSSYSTKQSERMFSNISRTPNSVFSIESEEAIGGQGQKSTRHVSIRNKENTNIRNHNRRVCYCQRPSHELFSLCFTMYPLF